MRADCGNENKLTADTISAWGMDVVAVCQLGCSEERYRLRPILTEIGQSQNSDKRAVLLVIQQFGAV